MAHITPFASSSMILEKTTCCVCQQSEIEPVGAGRDYEYDCCDAEFSVWRCRECGMVFINPRPSIEAFELIYPPDYHAYNFSDAEFGIVHRVRANLEAARLLRYCRGVAPNARILDVGCGDGFHLSLLRKFGRPGWRLEGADLERRAVEAARTRGLQAHHGALESLDLQEETYDLVYSIMTIEHVPDPLSFLQSILRVLKPGGRLVLVTDSTNTVDFAIFKQRYWGGYHFPRHFYLFNRSSLARVAQEAGFSVGRITTIVSPVNWVYSIHNYLVDHNAPSWLVEQFTLRSPISLGLFTMLDIGLRGFGREALLNAYLNKPVEE